MKTYLIIFVLLMSILGCGNKKTEPAPEPTKPLSPPKVEKLATIKPVKKSSFNEANFIVEDATTKVFKNCFKTGAVALEKSCKKKIDKFLKTTPLKHKRNVFIEIHTDKGGSAKQNLSISIKRAKKAAGSLFYKEYKNSKIYYKGFGESKLVYDEETKQANTHNRRIVVKLRPKNFKIGSKGYSLYKKEKKKKKKFTASKAKGSSKSQIKPLKVVQHKEKLNISSHTGKADIGWIYFGKPSLAKKFTISCSDDKPLKVKHKAIRKAKKDEFMSSFYDRKVTTSFNFTQLEISPMYIYENGKLPVSNPVLSLKEQGKTSRFQTTVNTYRGTKGILYRVFVNGKKRVSCVDLVISYEDDKLSYGRIYMKDGKEFALKP